MAPGKRKNTNNEQSSTISVQKSKTVKKRKISPNQNTVVDSDSENEIMELNSVSSIPENAPLTVAVLSKLLLENSIKVTEKIDQRFDSLDKSLVAQSSKLSELEEELQTVKESLHKVSSENQQLWKELSKLNLIFSGLKDDEFEQPDELYSKVSHVIRTDFSFDTAHRVRRRNGNLPRPIKVRFLSVLQRNNVLTNRFNVRHPIYINEDLPLKMRLDHKAMREKRMKLIEEGLDRRDIKMDWTKKTLCAMGMSYNFNEGILVDQIPIPNVQSQQSRGLSSNKSVTNFSQNPQNRSGFSYQNKTSQNLSNNNHTESKAQDGRRNQRLESNMTAPNNKPNRDPSRTHASGDTSTSIPSTSSNQHSPRHQIGQHNPFTALQNLSEEDDFLGMSQ
ncbi:hypothetical protein Fcan01_25993 [Folsomia candida]|uniref:Uncharacterized protein n=1 Tax=Folsomia candida TaxID=158441 RepID=A0A226D4M2_FOLCA|nr:hypothetical protein Fcan01_25993 [Folsomia candida]